MGHFAKFNIVASPVSFSAARRASEFTVGDPTPLISSRRFPNDSRLELHTSGEYQEPRDYRAIAMPVLGLTYCFAQGFVDSFVRLRGENRQSGVHSLDFNYLNSINIAEVQTFASSAWRP